MQGVGQEKHADAVKSEGRGLDGLVASFCKKGGAALVFPLVAVRWKYSPSRQ